MKKGKIMKSGKNRKPINPAKCAQIAGQLAEVQDLEDIGLDAVGLPSSSSRKQKTNHHITAMIRQRRKQHEQTQKELEDAANQGDLSAQWLLHDGEEDFDYGTEVMIHNALHPENPVLDTRFM